jgi:hypothetical protein
VPAQLLRPEHLSLMAPLWAALSLSERAEFDAFAAEDA